MNPRSLLWLLAAAPLITGCPHNEYTVEMVPQGAEVHRTLTVFRADGTDTNGQPQYQSFPSNELAGISSAYDGNRVQTRGEQHVLSGTFAGKLPADIGRSGFFTNVTTSLGSFGFYVERFRGSDDLVARVESRFAAADQLADLVSGWSAQQFANEPRRDQLQQFLKTQFRRDLKNLSLHTWIGEIVSSYKTNASEEFLVRGGQYLVERDYIHFTDVPGLVAAFQDGGDVVLARLLQRFAAHKLGLVPDEKLPASLAVFDDPKSLETSWTNYLAGTDLYRLKLENWKTQKDATTRGNPPEPMAIIGDLVGSLLDFQDGAADRLTVKLTLASAPVLSNGGWDAEHHQLIWSSELDSRPESARLPQSCFAVWSKPAEAFQKKHFGRVILSGEKLANYCSWQAGLDRQQGEEWEKFLASLTPAHDLTQMLETFKPAGAANGDWSAGGRNVLKSAGNEKPAQSPAAAQ